MFFLDPDTGSFPPFAPTFADPFTGFILPGAGAGGINIIDNTLQNPAVQQFNLGLRDAARAGPRAARRRPAQLRDALHHRAHDGHGLQPRGGRARPRRQPRVEREHEVRRAARLRGEELRRAPLAARRPTRCPRPSTTRTTTRSRSRTGPSTRTISARVRADARTTSAIASRSPGSFTLPGRVRLSPLLTLASAVPMDILMPDGQLARPHHAAQRRRPAVQDRRPS